MIDCNCYDDPFPVNGLDRGDRVHPIVKNQHNEWILIPLRGHNAEIIDYLSGDFLVEGWLPNTSTKVSLLVYTEDCFENLPDAIQEAKKRNLKP